MLLRPCHIRALLLLLAAVLAAGCRQHEPQPVLPQVDASLARSVPRYPLKKQPLRLGDRWRYDVRFSLEFRVEGGPPRPPGTFLGVAECELIGTEERFGREYIIEECRLYGVDQTDTLTTWARFRQDRTGLYQAGVFDTEPPTSATGAGQVPPLSVADRRYLAPLGWSDFASRVEPHYRAAARIAWRALLEKLASVYNLRAAGATETLPHNEVRRVAYPLRPGVEWTIREAPFRVDAVARRRVFLQLPVGTLIADRIHITNSLLGPEDVVRAWYGRCGRLRTFMHMELRAMDPETGEIVTIIIEEDRKLSSVELHPNNGCGSVAR